MNKAERLLKLMERSVADFSRTSVSKRELDTIKKLLKKGDDKSYDKAFDIALKYFKDPDDADAALGRLK